MAKDYPFGAGAGAFQYYGTYYIPTHIDTGKSRQRAVHSTWFETLSEAGFLGLLFFMLMIWYTFKAFASVRKELWKRKDFIASSFVLSLSSGFVTFIVCMTFINADGPDIFIPYLSFRGAVREPGSSRKLGPEYQTNIRLSLSRPSGFCVAAPE